LINRNRWLKPNGNDENSLKGFSQTFAEILKKPFPGIYLKTAPYIYKKIGHSKEQPIYIQFILSQIN